jgi:hypothetical protein
MLKPEIPWIPKKYRQIRRKREQKRAIQPLAFSLLPHRLVSAKQCEDGSWTQAGLLSLAREVDRLLH